jgi:type VI secretion system secreted protein VgrG
MSLSTLTQTSTAFLSVANESWPEGSLVAYACQGTLGLSKLFHFEITCLITHVSLQWAYEHRTDLLNTPLLLTYAASSTANPTYIHGLIESVTIDQSRKTCTLILQPCLKKCAHTQRNRVFENMTALDITQAIIKEHTTKDSAYFTVIEPKLIKPLTKKPFVMQYQESDLDFINRILNEAGLFYYFTFDNKHHNLHFSQNNINTEKLKTLIPLDYHTQRHANSVYHWKSIDQQSAQTFSVDDYNPYKPGVELISESGNGNSILTHHRYPAGQRTADEAEHLSLLALNRASSEAHYYHAQSGRLDIFPGQQITVIDEHKQAKTVFITQMQNHAYGHKHFKNNPEQQHRQNYYQCTFTAVPLEQPYLPICTHQKPEIFGLQTAVVIAKDDHYVDMDQLGSIRIRFHWEDSAHAAQNAAYCRVMQTSAGQNWGSLWTPRRGDEVLVSFQNGDIDCPIVIGSAYNSDNPPTYDLTKDPYKSGIKTTSIKDDSRDSSRYNELLFDNKMGNEKITLHAERDYSEIVKQDAVIIVQGKSQTKVSQGNMTIDVKQGAFAAQAAKQIQFSVGKSTTMTLTPAGITLSAPKIQLNPSSPGSGLMANLRAMTAGPTKPGSTDTDRYNLLHHDTDDHSH